MFIPYLYNWNLDNYVIMGVHRLYHENGGLNIEKVVTATTNTETNLQITGQLSGAGSITSINIEHGITMTQKDLVRVILLCLLTKLMVLIFKILIYLLLMAILDN